MMSNFDCRYNGTIHFKHIECIYLYIQNIYFASEHRDYKILLFEGHLFPPKRWSLIVVSNMDEILVIVDVGIKLYPYVFLFFPVFFFWK